MNKKQKVAIIVAVVIGLIVIIGVFAAIFGTDDTSNERQQNTPSYSSEYTNSPDTTESTTERQTTEPPTTSSPAEKKEEYIASCESYTFKQIARNPSEYEGKRAKFTGEVIQVMESYGIMYTLRVNITENEYGYYEDTIYVTYFPKDDNEPKILEDDIVTMYGELDGETTYEAVFGQSVTLPSFDCEYIDILTE